jgi:hypothetical protein
MKVEHYLITLTLTPRPTRLHTYLMTANRADVTFVAEDMVRYAEKRYGQLALPVIRTTQLNEAADQVREAIGSRFKPARVGMAKATNFHRTMWELAIDDPWDRALMALH